MKADTLRKSILQMAIEGKLVAQNSADEPASVLLEKIRAEKQKLIKEGKIKKDKFDSVIFRGADNTPYEKVGSEIKKIDDEIPFDIPETWEWVRVSDIGIVGSGYTPKENELSDKGAIPYFKVSDMNESGNELFMTAVRLFCLRPSKTFPPKTIIYPKNGGAVFTNKKRITTTESVVDLNTGTYSPLKCLNFDFVFLLFSNIDFRQCYKGTALPTINGEQLARILLPLPPLAEQARIVVRVKEFEPLLAEYGKLESAETELDTTLPDRLRKSILQYAVEGKLVTQDPTDEPAFALLDRIRKEKEALIKSGKIKRDKTESVIYKTADKSYYENLDEKTVCIDNEIPFDLPNNWAWCRLGSIVDFSKSTSVSSAQISADAWVLDLEDIEKDTGKLLAKKRMKDSAAKSDKHAFKAGNVLYSKLRPYLNKVIIADENGYCTSEILVFDFGEMLSEYAKIFLMSPFFVDYAMRDAYGVKMPRLGSQQGNAAFMPIPPLKEQQRIINAIKLAFEQLNLLK